MRHRAQVWITSVALSASGCAAAAKDEAPRRGPQTSATSDVDPYHVTPPGSGGSRSITRVDTAGAPTAGGGNLGNTSAGTGASTGMGTSAGTSAGGANASADTGMGMGAGTSAGGASTSAGTGMEAGAGAGTGGTPELKPSAGGTSGDVAGGAAQTLPNAGGTSSTDCPSPNRARLAAGACVDRIREFAVATRPTGIATGSDGKLWFDDGTVNQIVQLETDGRVVERWSVPAGSSEREVVAGSGDVLVWYTDPSQKTVWNRTKSGPVTGFELGFAPRGLAVGTGGKLWLTESNGAVYLADTVSATLTSWPAAASNTILIGPDGNPWFPSANGLISQLTSSGERRDFSIEDGVADDLVSGPDGALWFTDGMQHRIGRLDIHGRLSAIYELPPRSAPRRIISGPDGALWFTVPSEDEIGRLTLAGQLSLYPIPTKGGAPWAITVGPDQNLWFTENSSGKIGRLIPDSVE